MFWLSGGEEIMMLAFFVLIQYQSVTDGRTDGQTDIRPLAIPAVCIARYANALVKIDRNFACFWPPIFLFFLGGGERFPNFWSQFIKFTQVLIMWRCKKKEKNITSKI